MRNRKERRQYVYKSLILIVIITAIILALVAVFFFEKNRRVISQLKDTQNKVSPDSTIITNIDESELINKINLPIKESITRPLFSDTRRPYEPPEEIKVDKEKEAIVKEVDALNETLSGVILSGGEKIALMITEKGSLELSEGMQYKGWHVDSIDSDKIELSNGNKKDVKYLRNYGTSEKKSPPIIFD